MLIRNSFGRQFRTSEWDTKEGNTWMDADVLNRNMMGVVELSETGPDAISQML